MDTIVGREIARCNREHQPMAVMMVDVDHFKKVNDTYGHPGGDEVLKMLSALLEKVRTSYALPLRGGVFAVDARYVSRNCTGSCEPMAL